MDFEDRVVLVTGAAGNLGRAVAKTFEDRGARLVLLDRHREHLEKAFGAEDERRRFAQVDLLDPAQVNAAIEALAGRFGRIDALANLAGGFRMGTPVHATPDTDWNFLFDLNARTLLNMARAVVPRMLASLMPR